MAVSRDAVRWGYRFLLGREPESEEAIRAHLGVRNELHLARVLMDSREFASKKAQLCVQRTVQPELSTIEVESAATPDELARCLTKIKSSWSHLGSVTPHFSVLTDPQFLPENIDGTIETFWKSGELEADQAIRTLERHGLSGAATKTCVEYGCGVGRVTTGLSRRFKSVHAYDISAAHLELASSRAAALGLGNATFHECSANVLTALEPCDAFYSRIVFQHNPPPVIVELIRRALQALKPEGIALFQVPSYITGYHFKLQEWLAAEHPLDMQMHCVPQKRIFEVIVECGCALLEVREDGSAGALDKIVSNSFVVRKTSLPHDHGQLS